MSQLKRFMGAGILFPALLVVLTTVYLLATFDIRTMFGADGGVGPKTLPIVAAIIMYGALLIVLMKELRKPMDEKDAGFSSHLRPALVTIAIACYIALFSPVGYGISTFLFVAALFFIFKFKTDHPLAFVLYDLIITIVFYGLFVGLFDVRLPTLTGHFL